MDSKEFGLVFGQQITGLEDLHYGFWDEKVPAPSLIHLKEAQDRYTEQLVETLEHFGSTKMKIMDVGCGTGVVLSHLSQRGHDVDGVIPAPHLEKKVREKVSAQQLDSTIYPSVFEDVPTEKLAGQYDAILFSESFQYIPYQTAIDQAKRLLKPDGIIVICDFFKTENDGDGQPGDKSFGGGHKYSEFEKYLRSQSINVLENRDITSETSPNIDLLDKLLNDRIGPALGTLDIYLSNKKPWLLKIFKWFFRKKIQRMQYKYFSGFRSQAVFERYKTYRRIVLKMN